MDKSSSLLIRLAEARDRAEKAYLNVVLRTLEAGTEGDNSIALDVRLRMAVNEEQKRLKEMVWILDQLDKVE
jgi:hypothetical protein